MEMILKILFDSIYEKYFFSNKVRNQMQMNGNDRLSSQTKFYLVSNINNNINLVLGYHEWNKIYQVFHN